MIWFEIVAGNNGNDYEEEFQDFTSLRKALAYAKKLKNPYVRVDKFEGYEIGDGDYIDTVYEKGANIPQTKRCGF